MSVNTPSLADFELQFYKDNGFVAPAIRLFTDEDVQKMNDLIRPMIKQRIGTPQEYEITNLINKNPGFLDFIIKENVLDMVQKIIGPNFGLKECSAITKSARSKMNFQWHSDFNYEDYWEDLVKVNAVVLIVAVTPSTEESGCVQYIPKTHLVQSKRKLFPPAGSFPVVSLPLAEGFCSLHDVHILHKSDPNTSDYDRILLTFRFISTELTSVQPKAIEHLKKTSVGSIHLRGEDRHRVCIHSLVKQR